MLTSTSKQSSDKISSFPKLMIHKSGSVILATDEIEYMLVGTLIKESPNDRHKIGEYRKDWVGFVDFFGTVELKSE